MDHTLRKNAPSRTVFLVIITMLTLVSCQKKTTKPEPAPAAAPSDDGAVRAATSALSGAKSAASIAAESAAPDANGFGFRPARNVSALGPFSNRGTYEIEADRLTVRSGDATLAFPRGDWSDCVTPPDDSEVLTQKNPTWRLDGAAGVIALRFEATGLRLLARDDSDCTRERDLTPWMTGVAPDPDALLMPGPHTLEEMAHRAVSESEATAPPTAPLTSVIPAGWTISSTAKTSVVDLPAGTLTVRLDSAALGTTRRRWIAAREDETRHWMRFEVATEREYDDVDRALSQESSAVFTTTTDGAVIPRLVAERIYAAVSREEEDGREHIRRVVPTGEHQFVVDTTLRYYDGAQMIGVGKCPEMEGVVDIAWRSIETRWSWTDGEREHALGNASKTSLEVSACRDAVLPDFRNGPKLASDAQNFTPIDWQFTARADDPSRDIVSSGNR